MKFGYIPSKNDSRDFHYSQLTYQTRRPTKRKVLLPKIKVNEQIIGDCVGQTARSIKVHQELQNHPAMNYDFSPDFIYAECKKIDGIPNVEGTHPREAMKVLHKVGACRSGLYPRITQHNVRPQASSEAYESAEFFKIGAYAKVDTIDEMKLCIEDGVPVMAGFLMTDKHVSKEHEGYIADYQGVVVGAHAVALDGFDDDMVRTINGKTYKGFFRFINSWGTDWGTDGYGWMAYDYISLRTVIGFRYFDEAWTSVDVIMPDDNVATMTLWLDSKRAIVNGQEITMEVAPFASQEGRTFAPLRFLSESLGFTVAWNESERRIDIYK